MFEHAPHMFLVVKTNSLLHINVMEKIMGINYIYTRVYIQECGSSPSLPSL